MIHVERGAGRKRLIALPLMFFCTGCSSLWISGYRDDKYLQEYRYALGEQYIEVNGSRLCYEEAGHGEPVIILPGLGTSIDFWESNIPALAEHFHVIAVDPPGFGKSEKPDVAYDLPWITQQIIAFMDAKGIPCASFIGGSMGGHLALLLALRAPQRVDKLIVMGTSGVWPPPGILLKLALQTLWSDPIVTDYMRREWPKIFRMMFSGRTPLTEKIFRYQMAIRAYPTRYDTEGRAATRALRSIFFNSCRDRLAQVTQPVLVIWGEGDRIHLTEDAIFLRDHLPNSKLVIVPRCAHEVMVDQPEVFNQTVISFLKSGIGAVADHRP